MINIETRKKVYLHISEKQKYLYEHPNSGGQLFSIAQKYDLHKDEMYKKFAVTVGDIILGFYRIEDTIPLLQQELGIDAQTAALLGADVLEFLSPLSDPNWQPPVEETGPDPTDDSEIDAAVTNTEPTAQDTYPEPAAYTPLAPVTPPVTGYTPVYPPVPPPIPPAAPYTVHTPAPVTNYQVPTPPADPLRTAREQLYTGQGAYQPAPVPPSMPQPPAATSQAASPTHLNYEPVYRSPEQPSRATLTTPPSYTTPTPPPAPATPPHQAPRWTTE